jgi:RHS repeat-associated protein
LIGALVRETALAKGTASAQRCLRRLLGFEGMELDSVTGTNLALYRVQNPGTGRWTSQDPLGFGGGQTDLYVDVADAPTTQSDPAGLMSFVGPPPDPFGPPPISVYDYRQYQKLYDNGEISWWEWISIGIFPPSDVPVYKFQNPGQVYIFHVYFPDDGGPPEVYADRPVTGFPYPPGIRDPGEGGGRSKGPTEGPNPGHKPGRGHRHKTDVQATKKFAKQPAAARTAEEAAFKEACDKWNSLSPAQRKMRPELNPEKFLPVLWRRSNR